MGDGREAAGADNAGTAGVTEASAWRGPRRFQRVVFGEGRDFGAALVNAPAGDAEFQQVLVGLHPSVELDQRRWQSATEEGDGSQDEAVDPEALNEVPERSENQRRPVEAEARRERTRVEIRRIPRTGTRPRGKAPGGSPRRDGSVSKTSILLDDRATTTVGNAEGSAALMRAHGLRTALLVTSPYHMRRAIVIFRDRFRPLGLTVRASPVRDSFFQMDGWWKLPLSRDLVIREYLELAAFLLGLY